MVLSGALQWSCVLSRLNTLLTVVQGELVFKAHTFASLNSRLESNEEEERSLGVWHYQVVIPVWVQFP